MAHKFIKKDGKYYRINSDNTQTEVQLKDGYFHWTQPDKVKVRVKLDNNLTDMDKSESLLNKIGRMFTNATIGAANADSPAVMTASGWGRNKDGSWSQTDSKGAQELRRNLAVLSGTAYIPTAMATAPLIAPGTTGGAVIGNAAGSMAIGTALEEGQRAITGQSAGDIISSRLQQAGVPSILADAARPEYYINPTGAAAKTAWNAATSPARYGQFVTNNIRNRNRYFFDHMRPQEYSWKRIRQGAKAAGEMFYKEPPKFNVKFDAAGRELPGSKHPQWYGKTPEHAGIDAYREQAWAKYLGIPENEVQNVLYLPNPDGSFRYNKNLVNASEARKMFAQDWHFHPDRFERSYVTKDQFTTNGGNVKMTNLGEYDGRVGFEMSDVWDLHPVPSLLHKLGIKNVPQWMNIEVGPLLGGKPFSMRTRFSLDRSQLDASPTYYNGDYIEFIPTN